MVNPDGDLRSMEKLAALVRPGGLLFVSVPVGNDLMVFNAHRCVCACACACTCACACACARARTCVRLCVPLLVYLSLCFVRICTKTTMTHDPRLTCPLPVLERLDLQILFSLLSLCFVRTRKPSSITDHPSLITHDP